MFESVAEISPERVARDAALYVAHVENGESLSAIGRRRGCAPSTVLRAVRRVEDRRDDPLFEEFITDLGRCAAAANDDNKETQVKPDAYNALSKRDFDLECRRLLRKLEGERTFLLVADGAEKAGVFCPSNKYAKPVAMTTRDVALAMLSHDLIARRHTQGKASRYEITAAGRGRLARLTGRASSDEAAGGPTAFALQHQLASHQSRRDAARLAAAAARGRRRQFSDPGRVRGGRTAARRFRACANRTSRGAGLEPVPDPLGRRARRAVARHGTRGRAQAIRGRDRGARTRTCRCCTAGLLLSRRP